MLDFPMHDLASLLSMSFTLPWELTQCKIAASSKVDNGLANSVLKTRQWLCRKCPTHGFSNDFTYMRTCNEKHCRSGLFVVSWLSSSLFVTFYNLYCQNTLKNLKYLYFINVVDMCSRSQCIHAEINIFRSRSLVLPRVRLATVTVLSLARQK